MNAIARVADYPHASTNKIVAASIHAWARKDVSSNFYRPSKLIPVFTFYLFFSFSTSSSSYRTSNPSRPRATRRIIRCNRERFKKFAKTSRARFTARGRNFQCAPFRIFANSSAGRNARFRNAKREIFHTLLKFNTENRHIAFLCVLN